MLKFIRNKKNVQRCEFLNKLIQEGDYCEIFVCWLGNESEPLEHKEFSDLRKPVIEPLERDEQCYIIFNK